jgi:hypothetical protein
MAVGISGHNGWAVLVTVAVRGGAPVLVDRRRVELIEPGLPNQPYEHETLGLDRTRGEELVKEVRESALHCAERALAGLRFSLEAVGELVAIALRRPPLPNLPESVAAAHASYPVMVRADAMIYHDALCQAASSLGINVEIIARGEERLRAAETLRTEADRLDTWLVSLRRSLGPPWQRDHQNAMARAIAALGKRTMLKLPDMQSFKRNGE